MWHFQFSIWFEVLIRRGTFCWKPHLTSVKSDQWFQSHSDWKILKIIKNKRNAFPGYISQSLLPTLDWSRLIATHMADKKLISKFWIDSDVAFVSFAHLALSYCWIPTMLEFQNLVCTNLMILPKEMNQQEIFSTQTLGLCT